MELKLNEVGGWYIVIQLCKKCIFVSFVFKIALFVKDFMYLYISVMECFKIVLISK